MNLLRIAFFDGIERIIMICFIQFDGDGLPRRNTIKLYLFIVTLEVASVSMSALPFLAALPTKVQLVNVVSV